MPKMKKRTWEEHTALLEYLVDHTVKEAATHFNKTEAAIGTWIYTLRKNLVTEQAAINRIRTLQRISARVRKYTTSGKIKDEDLDEREEKY